jgi:hypothetical protein
MSNWMKNLVPAAALAALAACGGGGGGGGGGNATEADKNFPTAAASQTFAASSVTEANGLIEDINQARISGNIAVPGGALITGPATGVTSSGSLQCSTFGTGGSGSVDYTFSYDSNNHPVTTTLNYKNCTYTAGGYTLTMNGKVTQKWSNYTDASHYTLSWAYDLTYTYDGPSYHDSATLKTAQTCTQNGGEYDCRFLVNDGYLLEDGYDVSTSGSVITVNSATVTTANATVVISNWAYNTSTHRATSGTINVTYANGDHVTMTATGTGYTVVVTIGGNATTYTINIT